MLHSILYPFTPLLFFQSIPHLSFTFLHPFTLSIHPHSLLLSIHSISSSLPFSFMLFLYLSILYLYPSNLFLNLSIFSLHSSTSLSTCYTPIPYPTISLPSLSLHSYFSPLLSFPPFYYSPYYPFFTGYCLRHFCPCPSLLSVFHLLPFISFLRLLTPSCFSKPPSAASNPHPFAYKVHSLHLLILPSSSFIPPSTPFSHCLSIHTSTPLIKNHSFHSTYFIFSPLLSASPSITCFDSSNSSFVLSVMSVHLLYLCILLIQFLSSLHPLQPHVPLTNVCFIIIEFLRLCLLISFFLSLFLSFSSPV